MLGKCHIREHAGATSWAHANVCACDGVELIWGRDWIFSGHGIKGRGDVRGVVVRRHTWALWLYGALGVVNITNLDK